MLELATQLGYAYLAAGALTTVVAFAGTRPQKAVPIYARTVWACGLGVTWPVAIGVWLKAIPYGQPARR